VPGVQLALIDGSPATASTDANGNFGFTSVGSGMQMLEPTKQGDVNNAITALDATFVLQFVAGLRTFTGDQHLAGDVTGNGTVSALDATRILQFQAGTLPQKCSINMMPCSMDGDCPVGQKCQQHLPVADICGSDWAFRPMPVIVPNQTLVQPQTGEGMCTNGAIIYNPVTPPLQGQDFIAILFGDVTGNWSVPVAPPEEGTPPQPTPTCPPMTPLEGLNR